MKVKLGYNVYTQKEIEIDDKWQKLTEIARKEWGDLTKEEAEYFNENIQKFCNELDFQTGIDWNDISTLDNDTILVM